MHWSDRGVILSIHKFDEVGAVVRVLTATRGVCAGVDKYALSSRKRGTYQIGNLVEVEWKARLPEHLGTYRTELVEPLAAYVLDDALKLTALQSACEMLQMLLHERDPHPEIYDCMMAFLYAMRMDDEWLKSYVLFEFNLLTSLGFGLDLESCAATGMTQDLRYVSPKSGRAVSAEGAAGYENRLLKLPSFLLTTDHRPLTASLEILDGLRLCGYFLEARAFGAQDKTLPLARERFMKRCKQRLVNFGAPTIQTYQETHDGQVLDA
jgi:DNA repair protein RecO (recombination protein O)